LPPACTGYEVLGVRDGIKSIVSITPTDKERDFCKRHGFTLVEVPFDKVNGPSADNLGRFVETIKQGQGPFYVHCVGGTHRGGVLGVAYRLHHLGWTYERALVEFGRLGGDLKEDHLLLEAVKNYKP